MLPTAEQIAAMDAPQLEEVWFSLDVMGRSDDIAVERGMITKDERLGRDIQRQKIRFALEVRAAQLRSEK